MPECEGLIQFKSPPPIYRPVPFWSWNETMEVVEVRRQVDMIAAAGWGGIFIHSRIGLLTEYLSEAWFEAVAAAIEQCRKRRIKVWLYDENIWPSGFSGGTVPLADESFRMKVLLARPAEAPAPVGCQALGPVSHGLQVYVWTAPLGHPQFKGTCHTDHLNPEAMAMFVSEAYQSYYDRFSPDYGSVIVAEFTDEPAPMFRDCTPRGAVPYSPYVLERFAGRYGYNAEEQVHLLFRDAPEATRFRLQYYRIVNELFEENFSGQLSDWCREHGIALTGHYMDEAGLWSQQLWGYSIVPNYRRQQIPGIDHLARQVNEKITAKQCQSVVNQYGKNRMMSEMYGCAGQGMSFEDRLWIASQQMALGVNLVVEHLSLYTMAGCRKRDFPPNLYYQQPWWPLNRVLDDQISRTCYALCQGKYHAEALLLHPQESAAALWQSRVDNETELRLPGRDESPVVSACRQHIDKLDSSLQALIDTLLGDQRTFDLGDETILAESGEATMVDNQACFCVGEMKYRVVIVPDMFTIRPTTLELLEQFTRVGGWVWRIGDGPGLLDGKRAQRLDDWLESVPEVTLAELPAVLGAAVNPAIRLIGLNEDDKRMVFVHVRDLDEGDRLVYLTNLSRTRTFKGETGFSGCFRSVHLLDTRSGEENELVARQDGDGLTVELPFAPTQNHLLRLSREGPGPELIYAGPGEVGEVIELAADSWTVERLDENAITLDNAYWREGHGEFSPKAMPVLAVQCRLDKLGYDGPLTLRYPVEVRELDGERQVHMVIEYPERYQIRLNDKTVEQTPVGHYRDFRWTRIDITGWLRRGTNVIELHQDDFQHGDLTSFDDQFGQYGTEIESIYLVGDFSVAAEPTGEQSIPGNWDGLGLPEITARCLAAESVVLTNPAELRAGNSVLQGLPFYAGCLRMTADIPPVKLGQKRAILQIDRLDAAVAEVAVDAVTVGNFVSYPLDVDLTEAIRSGGRRLALTLYGTLRNLLGPHHNSEGELPGVSPYLFRPWYGPGKDYSPEMPNWLMEWTYGGPRPSQWRDSYCVVSFGDLGRIAIELRK